MAQGYGMHPDEFFRRNCPDKIKVIERLRPRSVAVSDTMLKYVIVAVGGSQLPLEDLVGYKPSGRAPVEIFEKDVMAALGSGWGGEMSEAWAGWSAVQARISAAAGLGGVWLGGYI